LETPIYAAPLNFLFARPFLWARTARIAQFVAEKGRNVTP